MRMVVCMLPEMSTALVNSRRIEIDTTFKAVAGWKEFEIVSWDANANRCAWSLNLSAL